MIIIPAIDIQDGRCVRLTQGKLGTTTVYSDDPLEFAKRWSDLGAQRLHLVDLDGAFEGIPKNFGLIQQLVKSTDIPVQVGGGIRTLESINKYMDSGVDSVILGSKATENPIFIKEACALHPGRIMVGIDAKAGRVMVKGWTEDSGFTAIELARAVAELGVGKIIYTDVERDGMLAGPNFSSIAELLANSTLPIIASGGIGRLGHIKTLKEMKPHSVEGLIIGKALYTGDVDLAEALSLTLTKKETC